MEHLNLRITAVQNFISTLYIMKRKIDKNRKPIPKSVIKEFHKVGEIVDKFYPYQTSLETAERILGV